MKKTWTQLLSCLLLSLSISSFSKAESRAVDQDLFKTIQREAEQSNPHAQYYLGLLYYWMNYYGKAHEWFEKAAEQGLAQAQFSLGVMYDQGRGVPQNDVKAFEWYEKSAQQGDVDAQLSLGVMYMIGQGTPQNQATAKELFKQACDNGDKTGCNNYRLLMSELAE
ncbi:tetratricopeptide repeat protein [Paenalcaligenes sp. Me131]|uniref:tetratricopeptide repeat protein n=1 Tax=Paenalcaligenes sp. Me131 TaxID=3392636 RepID=UPI003D2A53A1